MRKFLIGLAFMLVCVGCGNCPTDVNVPASTPTAITPDSTNPNNQSTPDENTPTPPDDPD